MTTLGRDRRLLHTFTQLADTLVDDYDVVELMQVLVDTCRAELEVAAAGLLLADASGELELIASTSESVDVVEALLLGSQRSSDSGFTSIHSIPLRLRDKTIGSLTLLQDGSPEPGEDELMIARALADVATIGILHERALRETAALSEQLQHALNSRVVIEQAKGVVSHTNGVAIDDAFGLIRSYARSNGERLSDVARRIVSRELTIE